MNECIWNHLNKQKLLGLYKVDTDSGKVVAIQQVSGSIHLQLVGLLKFSGQSDNTATQGIYNKSNVQCM